MPSSYDLGTLSGLETAEAATQFLNKDVALRILQQTDFNFSLRWKMSYAAFQMPFNVQTCLVLNTDF